MPLSGACSGRLLGLDFTKISPQPRNCSTEPSGGGTCAPLGKRDIPSKVDSIGVAEKRCHVSWGYSCSMPDQSDRVSNAVQADYGDPSLPGEALEPVAVRVRLDGLSKRVHEHQAGLYIPSTQDEPVSGLACLHRAE
jgi:hypothetical protein